MLYWSGYCVEAVLPVMKNPAGLGGLDGTDMRG